MMEKGDVIHPDKLQQVRVVGKGSFGVVEQCVYTPPDGPPGPVAVKKLKPGTVLHAEDVRAFGKEVVLLRKLHNKWVGELPAGHCCCHRNQSPVLTPHVGPSMLCVCDVVCVRVCVCVCV